MGSTSAINNRRRKCTQATNADRNNSTDRPSSFVLSPDGEKTQKKIWNETVALLKEEATGLDTSVVT